MLPAAISGTRFEPVCRGRSRIIEASRLMKHVKLPNRLFLDATETLDESTRPQGLGGAITKRPDHRKEMYTASRYTTSV
jgi:hypothetical protein